jgi:type IV secretion system protein VirD4
MLDEFPALGRLEFFETNLAFMAGYGIRAYLIAQSLNQIAKAYGDNNAILDNCHVRIAFACNDERTARRISDLLGTATEQTAKRSFSGRRFTAYLSHVTESVQETARPLLTAGEVMRLSSDEAIVLFAALAPIRAKKLRHFQDANFLRRLLPPPVANGAAFRSSAIRHDWMNQQAREHAGLQQALSTWIDGELDGWNLPPAGGSESILETVEPGELVDPLLFGVARNDPPNRAIAKNSRLIGSDDP